MSVFGDLEDFPLAEVLPLLAFRRGALRVALEEQGRIVEVHVNEQGVVAVGVEGRSLSPWEALETLRGLMRTKRGKFWFDAETSLPSGSKLNWPVEHVLFEITETEDEMAGFANQLPDPRTQFRLSPKAQGVDLGSLSLQLFLANARPLLERGATAQEVASHLKISEDYAALQLHRLRLAGYVEPRRAFSRGTATKGRPSLLRRLWRALVGGE